MVSRHCLALSGIVWHCLACWQAIIMVVAGPARACAPAAPGQRHPHHSHRRYWDTTKESEQAGEKNQKLIYATDGRELVVGCLNWKHNFTGARREQRHPAGQGPPPPPGLA